MLRAATVVLLLSGVAMAQRPPAPAPSFEDQLYMIGRAQEEELRQLRKENDDLKKRVDELSKKMEDPPKDK